MTQTLKINYQYILYAQNIIINTEKNNYPINTYKSIFLINYKAFLASFIFKGVKNSNKLIN